MNKMKIIVMDYILKSDNPIIPIPDIFKSMSTVSYFYDDTTDDLCLEEYLENVN